MFVKNLYHQVVLLVEWDQLLLNYLWSDALSSAQVRTAFYRLSMVRRLEAVSSVWILHAIRR